MNYYNRSYIINHCCFNNILIQNNRQRKRNSISVPINIIVNPQMIFVVV